MVSFCDAMYWSSYAMISFSTPDHVCLTSFYLPVQEEPPGFCVWTGSSRDNVAEVLRNTIRSRKNVRMKRISEEIHDLKESLA